MYFCKNTKYVEIRILLKEIIGGEKADKTKRRIYGTKMLMLWKSKYGIITVRKKGTGIFLSSKERRILRWLRYSGFRIGIAELVALEEKHIQPDKGLLSDKNWKVLAEKIYGAKPLSNNKIERQMEHSKSRNDTVAALMHLVKLGRVRLN